MQNLYPHSLKNSLKNTFDYFAKISTLVFNRANHIKVDVYDNLNKILSLNVEQLGSVVSRNNFLLLFSDFLRAVFTPHKQEVQVFFHNRREENQWHNLFTDQRFSFAVTNQLQFFVDEQNYCTIEAPNPLYKKICEFTGLSNPGAIFLFHFFHTYDFLIVQLSTDYNLGKTNLLVELIVRELQIKIATQQRIETQHHEIDHLRNELSEVQNNLKQTERLLKKRAYEIHNLIEISNELYSILNFEQLINSALLTLVGQLSCQRTFAMMYNPLQRKYSQNFSKGFKVQELDSISIELDHALIGYLLKRPRPHLVKDLIKTQKIKEIARKLKELEIEMIAPLIHHDRLKGIVGCGAKLYEGQFDNADIQIFSIFVNIISISISNSQMYEDVKQMSFTDAMTNLNNYRYFENRLVEEINRCRRNKTAVSLIMLDIDEFKNYNDELGHQAGDEALRTVGWILKNTVRDGDIVNRYGGEEFAIILPGMEKELISILAERIRIKIEEYPFYKEHVQPGGSLTVSLGGATFPTDADDFDSLVHRADEALYHSKRAGRNRCTIYDPVVINI